MTYDEILAEEQEHERLYAALVASLTPAQKAAWNKVLEDHDRFDGEPSIALGFLEKWKALGRLG